MLQIKKIFFLLNKEEKLNFYLLIFLMLINSILEVLGISSIIPIISITLNNDFSAFENLFFYEYLNDLSKNENFILISFLFVGAVFIFKNTFIIFYNFFLNKFHSKTAERFSNDIYSYYLNIDYKNYLKLSTSKLVFDTTEAVEIFRGVLQNASNFLLELIVLLIIVSFLIFLNPVSTITILFILLLLSIFFYMFFVKQNFYWGSEVAKSSKKRINILNTSFSSIKDVRIYSGELFFFKKFKITNYLVNNFQKIHFFFSSIPKPFFETFIVIILLSSLYYLLRIENLGNDLIILNLAVFAVSLFRIYPSIYRIAECFQKSNYGRAVLNDLNNLFEKQKIIKSSIFNSHPFKNEIIDFFILKNVSFNYDDDKKKILKDLNLELKKNEFVGIRGETGAGKSTLVDIISGLLKPEKGSFTINDKNFLELPSNWHKNISYVPQNISLINDSLEKNIALTINEKEINKNKILQSIKLSCLTDFFNSSNQEQNLGERGVQVSGGERQRIGIARALYYDRNIYIFDEATNALDENTESKILENLKFYLKNKIVIIISHKKTTLKFCDKIYNFINGELN